MSIIELLKSDIATIIICGGKILLWDDDKKLWVITLRKKPLKRIFETASEEDAVAELIK